MIKYAESIKALESAKKGLEGVVDKMDRQMGKTMEKMEQFEERIQEYVRAIKLLKGKKK